MVTKNPKTNLEFIDKWITISKISSIEPFIIFNKIDLLQNGAFQEDQKIYERIGIKTFQISAKFFTNVDELKKYLSKKTTIFVGNSGSGKSTLTSAITGKEILSKALSNNQGVHTTSISTLYEMPNKTKIIDSPGVRDLPITGWDEKEIIRGFSEIFTFAKECKFNDCNHINNEGCAVITKLMNGEINESRYNNFIKFRDGEDDE